jgi:hypothetical protein
LKILRKEGVDPIQLQKTLDELHKSFHYTRKEQKYITFSYDVLGVVSYTSETVKALEST